MTRIILITFMLLSGALGKRVSTRPPRVGRDLQRGRADIRIRNSFPLGHDRNSFFCSLLETEIAVARVSAPRTQPANPLLQQVKRGLRRAA